MSATDLKGSAAASLRVSQLLSQYTERLRVEADRIATSAAEAERECEDDRKKIDKQEKIQLVSLNNNLSANVLKNREELIHLVNLMRSDGASPVVPFIEVGNLSSIVNVLERPIDGVPMFLQLFNCCNIAISGDGSEEERRTTFSSLIYRVITSSRPRAVIIHLLNPGLHNEMSMFNALNKKGKFVGFINAMTKDEVKSRLSYLKKQVADSQVLMQSGDATLGDYLSKQKTGDSRPYDLLCISDFPDRYDEEQVQDIKQLMNQGPRFGVSTIIQFGNIWGFKQKSLLDSVINSGQLTFVEVTKQSTCNVLIGRQRFGVEIPLIKVEEMHSKLKKIADEGSEAPITKLDLVEMLPLEEKWKEDSRDGLRVPIGTSGEGIAEVVIGGIKENTHHALIGGRAGSGKSSLLYALIYGLAFRYSPDELAMYLLDYKEGVEFARFTDTDGESFLPHARIVGIESDVALGAAVLQSLEVEMEARGELFRAAGQSRSITEYRNKTKLVLPRLLLIVDEFQDMLDGGENVRLLQNLAKQGRSFGIHIILSTQTISDNQTLFGVRAALLDQFALRICLMCSKETSQMILSDSNDAAFNLLLPGDAILNDRAGAKEANKQIRVAFAETDKLDTLDKVLQDLICPRCHTSLDRSSRTKCLHCSKTLQPGKRYNAPLVVQANIYEKWPDQRLTETGEKRPTWKNGAQCSIGRPFKPSSPQQIAFFGDEPYGHLLVVGRGSQEAQSVIQAAIVGLAVNYQPGLLFIVAEHGVGVSSNIPGFEELRSFVTEAGHQMQVVHTEDELVNAIKSENRENRMFIIVPKADTFEFSVAKFSTPSFLGGIVKNGHHSRVHLIGWWENVGEIKNVSPDYLTIPVQKVFLDVTQQELGSFAKTNWPWKRARAFWTTTQDLNAGQWFVPYKNRFVDDLRS